MALGGNTVGKVSVKVVPDTTRFSQQLRAQHKKADDYFSIDIGLNTERALAEFKALKARLEGQSVNLNVDINKSFADQISGALSGVIGQVSDLLSSVARSSASNAFSAMTKQVGGLAKYFGRFKVSIRGVLTFLGKVIFSLGVLLPLMLGLAGAVMSLIGALTAGFAGLPVLFTALLAPIAAVRLGMEGIKDAAKTLAPEIKELKSSLSETFRQGLAQAFKQLEELFPSVKRGLNGVAESVSKFARIMTDTLTTPWGIKNIESAFKGVQRAIEEVIPASRYLLDELLKIAGTESLYKILGETVSMLASDFATFLSRVRKSGKLTTGLKSLKKVLGGVSDFLTELSIAALDFFNGAASGLEGFFRGLADVISRVNWERLGRSFGGVLKSLAQYFKNISSEQINGFVTAIERLAGGIGRLIKTGVLTAFVEGLGLLITLFAGLYYIASYAVDTIRFFINLAKGAVNTMRFMTGQISVYELVNTNSFKNIAETMGGTSRRGTNEVIDNLNHLLKGGRTKLNQFEGVIKSGASGAAGALVGAVSGGVGSAVKKLDQLAVGASGSMGQFSGTVSSGAGSAMGSMNEAIRGGVGDAGREVGRLPGVAEGAIGPLGGTLWSAGSSLISGFVSGIRSMFDNIRNVASTAVSIARRFFPFSPAKEGPFSGKGYTLYSGRALIRDWAKGIEDAAPGAIREVEQLMSTAQSRMTADIHGEVESDTYGISSAVFDGVMAAFNDGRLHIDGDGVTRLVNSTNAKNKRR